MKGFELIELEEKLQSEDVTIDVERLVKSNIKQIIIPLHRFIEWQCLDLDGKILRNSKMFDKCLKVKDATKAKTLNRLSKTHIWNLLDEDVKKDMDFDDFFD